MTAQQKPLLKLVSFKGIVFLSWIQSVRTSLTDFPYSQANPLPGPLLLPDLQRPPTPKQPPYLPRPIRRHTRHDYMSRNGALLHALPVRVSDWSLHRKGPHHRPAPRERSHKPSRIRGRSSRTKCFV